MTTYTIGQLAERSGFPASTLRYYEGLGLVPAAERTPAGYRRYGPRSLERLAFVARAKQLGCSLDEIGDLLGLWDGDGCEPVQRRLHDLVSSKLRETEVRIADLTALAEQLREAASRLAGPASDGPCDEHCACLSSEGGSGAVTPVPLGARRGR